MAITISIALQKGGTGKTATAQALASTLGFKHKKVLLVDLDSQCDATYFSNIDDPEYTIYDVLGDGCTANEAIVSCKYYDILPATPKLTNIEMTEDIEPTLFKDAIKPILANYDFVIVDTPPALGHLSFNALVASDYIIIPSEPRPAALRGIQRLHTTIKTIQNSLNSNLKILGILLIKYSNRTILNRDIGHMIEDYAEQMNTTIFNATIREGVALAEAQTMRTPLIDYAKSSKPNIDYKAFTTEVLQRIGDL